MRIAVLADLHLTDSATSVKHDVLEWLAMELAETHVDLIAAIGDMTALGTDSQTRRVQAWLDSLNVPWCSTPGNAELRTRPENARAWQVPPPPGAPLLMVDTSWGRGPDAKEQERMECIPDDAKMLLATHAPPSTWPDKARNCLVRAVARRAVQRVVAGHLHHDDEQAIRGLDPDKAAGGPPMFAVFDNDGGVWTCERHEMAAADIRAWPLADRMALFSHIGVSAMQEPLETLEEAARLGITCMELREHTLENMEEHAVVERVRRWRECGGRILSLHLPNLIPGDDNGGLLASARRAIRLGCDRVTLHVPQVTATGFPAARDRLMENFLARMAPVLENSLDIGIENLHTSPGHEGDDIRNYGCTIGECRQWIDMLKERTGNPRIGFHLDIGHARNNPPFKTAENLSDYYAELGPCANGMHLHQVLEPVPGSGDSGNHRPFTALYGKLISLAGVFLAWRKGQFAQRPPMFLEIRGSGLAVKTYLALQRLAFQKL